MHVLESHLSAFQKHVKLNGFKNCVLDFELACDPTVTVWPPSTGPSSNFSGWMDTEGVHT